jgi:hypothetical protein
MKPPGGSGIDRCIAPAVMGRSRSSVPPLRTIRPTASIATSTKVLLPLPVPGKRVEKTKPVPVEFSLVTKPSLPPPICA